MTTMEFALLAGGIVATVVTWWLTHNFERRRAVRQSKEGAVQDFTIEAIDRAPAISYKTSGIRLVGQDGKDLQDVWYYCYEMRNTTLTHDLENFTVRFDFRTRCKVVAATPKSVSPLAKVKVEMPSESVVECHVELLNRGEELRIDFTVANVPLPKLSHPKIDMHVKGVRLVVREPDRLSDMIVPHY